MNQLLTIYGQYMLLKIYVPDDELKQVYIDAANRHNSQNSNHINAGFDLFVPGDITVRESANKIDMKIICEAEMVSVNRRHNTGYYLYPRSSLSKTPLRMANSLGIIDSGYRGNIIGVFDTKTEYTIRKHDRLLQICAPSLAPIWVEITNNLDLETERGTRGFGSSGK